MRDSQIKLQGSRDITAILEVLGLPGPSLSQAKTRGISQSMLPIAVGQHLQQAPFFRGLHFREILRNLKKTCTSQSFRHPFRTLDPLRSQRIWRLPPFGFTQLRCTGACPFSKSPALSNEWWDPRHYPRHSWTSTISPNFPWFGEIMFGKMFALGLV